MNWPRASMPTPHVDHRLDAVADTVAGREPQLGVTGRALHVDQASLLSVVISASRAGSSLASSEQATGSSAGMGSSGGVV
jgi:hypothetical protein